MRIIRGSFFIGCMLASALLLVAPAARAQTPVFTAASKLAFDEAGQDAATAGGATYLAYLDGATTGVALTGVVCTATISPAGSTCLATYTALQPGPHTVALTQKIGSAESAKSAVFAFTFTVVTTPTNLRNSGGH